MQPECHGVGQLNENELASLKNNISSLEARLAAMEMDSARLRGERDFFKSILDTIEVKISLVDPRQGRIIYMNQAGLGNMELEYVTSPASFEEAIGKFIAEEDHLAMREQIAQVLATGRPVTTEMWTIATDGSRSRSSWTAKTLNNKADGLMYLIASGVDVTSRWKAEEALRTEKEHLKSILVTSISNQIASGKFQSADDATQEAALKYIQKLEETKQRLEAITASIPGVVYQFTINQDGAYSFPYISESVTPLMGLNPRKIEADHMEFFKLIPPEEMPAFTQSIEISQKTLADCKHEFRIVLHGGAEKWFLWESVPHVLPNGQVIWNGVCVDITLQKKAEETLKLSHDRLETQVAERTARLAEGEERYRALSDSAFEGIIVHDNGIVLDANSAFYKMFGYSPSELLGRNAIKLLAPEEFRAEMAANIAKEFRGTYESAAVRKDGKRLDIELRGDRIAYKNGFVSITAIRDITERKLAEKELLAAREAAENATRLKDRFVALVSHDLRSPLFSIYSALSIVEPEFKTTLEPKHFDLVKGGMQRLQALMEMIERLLDVNRIKSGVIKPQKVFIHARDLAEKVFFIMKLAADEKRIMLVNNVPEETRLFADYSLLSQVMQNLAHNAIKFSNEGGVVTISISPLDPNTLVVEDMGIGIADDKLGALFKPKAGVSEKGTGGEKGYGLGLPLSYDIMKAHGGDLTVETKPGEGSRFYCKLPGTRPVVMVVDDQDAARRRIADLLTGAPVEIIEAENGIEALAKLAEPVPNLIITDINMPHMDGLALLEKLKATPVTADIPVIVMTSTEETLGIREELFRKGAADFVQKPIIPEDFMPRTKRFMGI